MNVLLCEILSWPVDLLKTSSSSYKIKNDVSLIKPLPTAFRTVESYRTFLLKSVLEETREISRRAILQNLTTEFTLAFPVVCNEWKAGVHRKKSVLCIGIFKIGTLKEFSNVVPNTLVEVMCVSWRGLGLLHIYYNGPDNEELSVKLLLPKELYQNFDSLDLHWQIKNLGLPLTLKLSMHETLSQEFKISYFNQLANGLKKVSNKISKQASPSVIISPTHSALTKLNKQQKAALLNFIESSTGELQLLHAPPGTGKTTTLSALLHIFWTAKVRCLASSPSDKAVRVLAGMFLKETYKASQPCPPVVMLSTADKIFSEDEENLRSIYIETWAIVRQSHAKALLIRLQILANALKSPPKKPVFADATEITAELEDIRVKLSLLNKEIVGMAPEWGCLLIKGLQAAIENVRDIQNGFVFTRKKNLCLADVFLDSYTRSLSAKKAETACALLNEIHKQWCVRAAVLANELRNHAVIVFSPLYVLSRSNLRKCMRPFEAFVVDECGQSSEPETCVAYFYAPKKCLLVGDVTQHPATPTSCEAENKGYGRSLLERLLKNDYSHVELTIQYRMHPEILKFPNYRYYRGLLVNAEGLEVARQAACHAVGCLGPYSFINCPHSTETAINLSYSNQFEAEVIAEIVKTLKEKFDCNLNQDIAILTFFEAQVEAIKAALTYSEPELSSSVLQVHTIESFQGCERDIVLLSTVRTRDALTLWNDFRRLNVALTRARFSMIIIGHAQTLLSAHGTDLEFLVKDALARDVLYNWQQVRTSFQTHEKNCIESFSPIPKEVINFHGLASDTF
ncbi:uncharacterized protein LOC135144287 isoform X2 [Zophobas morio]|uniref:uncharacterized protein LOC135144287 isoform X2 n=1 Tax=Zophobas morio TaxID=2755281 RepID=UPI0030832E30